MCDVTGPRTAAVIALNAIGKQDPYLVTDDTETSLFHYTEKRHSEFTKFHRTTIVTTPTKQKYWPFGPDGYIVKVTLNPQEMGDLLSNMYLVMDLPPCYYNRNVGDSLFEYVSLSIDGQEVERLYGDWQVIYNEMYLDPSQKAANKYLLDRMLSAVTPEDDEYNADADSMKSTLRTIVPLHFFFGRKYSQSEYDTNSPDRPYFPLCAISKQKIILEFKFNSVFFFSKPIRTNGVGEPSYQPGAQDIFFNGGPVFDFPTLDNFKIITEEMKLCEYDRLMFVKQSQTMVYDVMSRNATIDTSFGTDVVKLNLTPQLPVKTLHWFLRKKEYEYVFPIPFSNATPASITSFAQAYDINYIKDGINIIDSRYRFTAMKSAKIVLNGLETPNINTADHTYFKYIVPFQRRLTTPSKNIYTYCFCMNPLNVEPSGSLDFGQMNSDKTFLEVKMQNGSYTIDFGKTYTQRLSQQHALYLYFTNYQTFSFKDGYVRLAQTTSIQQKLETGIEVPLIISTRT